MQKKITLLKVLTIMFQISEIYIGIGLIGSLFLFPYATSIVESKHGNIAFFVSNGSPRFHISSETYDPSLLSIVGEWAAHENTEGALNYDQQTPIFSFSGFGNISCGPFRFSAEKARYPLNANNLPGEAIQMDTLTGMVTYLRPGNPAEILSVIKGPFLLSIFCTGLISITILELLSQLFKRVDRGEAFTQVGLRRVRLIGILFVVSGLLRPLTTHWLRSEMVDYATRHVAHGIFLQNSIEGNFSAITTGLVILALAELFRQGLLLKEETALTI